MMRPYRWHSVLLGLLAAIAFDVGNLLASPQESSARGNVADVRHSIGQELEPDDPIEVLTIIGVRPPKEPKTSAEAITQPSLDGHLRRWVTPLCVRFLGGQDGLEQAFLKHLMPLASSVGLSAGPVGSKRCHDANVIIVLSDNPSALLTDKKLFLKLNEYKKFNSRRLADGVTIPSIKKYYWMATDDYLDWAMEKTPVKYWHKFYSQTKIGLQTSSRIFSGEDAFIYYSSVFIDSIAISEFAFDSVMDHIAFVVLTGVEPYGIEVPHPSILNLFSNDAAGRNSRLSDFDKSYLEALYYQSSFRRNGYDSLVNRISQRVCRNSGYCD